MCMCVEGICVICTHEGQRSRLGAFLACSLLFETESLAESGFTESAKWTGERELGMLLSLLPWHCCCAQRSMHAG